MQNHRFNRLVAAGAVGLAGLVSMATLPAASASATGSSINISQPCGTNVVNLQAQTEDTGLVSVDFGVDMAQPIAGVPWKVKEARNGKIFVSTTVKTTSDGSFSITRTLPPVPGTSTFTASAVDMLTGQTCSISGSM
jgi:hypothetical protein